MPTSTWGLTITFIPSSLARRAFLRICTMWVSRSQRGKSLTSVDRRVSIQPTGRKVTCRIPSRASSSSDLKESGLKRPLVGPPVQVLENDMPQELPAGLGAGMPGSSSGPHAATRSSSRAVKRRDEARRNITQFYMPARRIKSSERAGTVS